MNHKISRNVARAASVAALLGCIEAVTGCPTPPPPEPPTPEERGRALFFNETFNGNGRTCATCHREEDNFGLSPTFIATLPDDDPLFVAETVPDLAENFENPVLMRLLGLILENQDGFDDLENNFNMRGIPHTLAMRMSVASRDGPRTGWSGDGAPGDGSLRSFATGAVIQHFPLTTNRVADVDFRLPTDQELDDMEAFMLSLGRQEDLQLPLPLKGVVASRGQELFNDVTTGKCFGCHNNAGANANPGIFGEGAGNMNFNTGVEDLPDQPADLTGEKNPPDDGFGIPGNGEFNTPPLVEAADTPPFFHNNSVATIEGAVAFYNGESFTNSPAGQLVAGATGGPINLDATQVDAVGAFLRVINALENIRQSIALLDKAATSGDATDFDRLRFANEETDDAIMVLSAAGLHPEAVSILREAKELTSQAADSSSEGTARDAIAALERARDELVESQ
jgi:mono/diheme cytochrome c family protein